MSYYVYIIFSPTHHIYYKGMTANPEHRLYEHNNGFSRYTKNKGMWKMVYLEKCEDKRSSLIREKQLKRYNHTYIENLIQQPQNLLK